SPEQCRGRDVDHRTDIYAFGCVTYRMLTGVYPFDGPDYMEILMKQINQEPYPPSDLVADLPASVDAVVSWMLRKDPAERPPNLIGAVRALEESAEASASASHTAPSGRFAAPSPTPSPMKTPGRPGAAAAHATADTLAADSQEVALPVTSPPRARGGGR